MSKIMNSWSWKKTNNLLAQILALGCFLWAMFGQNSLTEKQMIILMFISLYNLIVHKADWERVWNEKK